MVPSPWTISLTTIDGVIANGTPIVVESFSSPSPTFVVAGPSMPSSSLPFKSSPARWLALCNGLGERIVQKRQHVRNFTLLSASKALPTKWIQSPNELPNFQNIDDCQGGAINNAPTPSNSLSSLEPNSPKDVFTSDSKNRLINITVIRF